MNNHLAIDLFCGLGGWTEGLLAEGWYVLGFDIERHRYPKYRRPEYLESGQKSPIGSNPGGSLYWDGEWMEYPGQLVLQDVLTLHGSQFKDADLIVASPPCQAYSYRAMPWSRAKALPPPDNTLFEACFRIQREACEAAGRHIPLVVENVRGAQKWVGRARWNFGSFYLWGDVPALMPIIAKRPAFKGGDRNIGRASGEHKWNQPEDRGVKVATMGAGWYPPDHPKHVSGLAFNTHAERAIKNSGGSWFNVAHNTTSGKGQNPDGRKVPSQMGRRTDLGKGARFTSRENECWIVSCNTPEPCEVHGKCLMKPPAARKAASAMIAKIPFPLSQHIARVFKPLNETARAA